MSHDDKPHTPATGSRTPVADLGFWRSQAENLDGILTDKEAHIDSLIRRIGHLERVIVDQSAVVNDYLVGVQGALDEKEDYAKNMRQLVANLQAALTERESSHERVSEYADNIASLVDNLQAALADREGRIGQLEEYAENLQRALVSTDRYAQNVSARLEELSAREAVDGAHQDEIDAKRIEVDRLNRILGEILDSRSWRMTAPLRQAMAYWRRWFLSG